MKTIILFTFLLVARLYPAEAQRFVSNAREEYDYRVAVTSSNIKTFVTSPKANVQIISPEPIIYVDLSVPWVHGDLPIPTICRLHADSSVFVSQKSYVVTIVTQNYLMSYKLICNNGNTPYSTYVIKANRSDALPINL